MCAVNNYLSFRAWILCYKTHHPPPLRLTRSLVSPDSCQSPPSTYSPWLVCFRWAPCFTPRRPTPSYTGCGIYSFSPPQWSSSSSTVCGTWQTDHGVTFTIQIIASSISPCSLYWWHVSTGTCIHVCMYCIRHNVFKMYIYIIVCRNQRREEEGFGDR